jgi:DNA-directed RNA polymerase specialized sigma24 family protein
VIPLTSDRSNRQRRWTAGEDKLLRIAYGQLCAKELAALLGRTHKGVHARAWDLGLTRQTRRGLAQRLARAVVLRDSGLTQRQIAQRLGVSQMTVWTYLKAVRDQGQGPRAERVRAA